MARDYAVGVCGFGRCGSTMVMRMLDVGGLPPVEGSSELAYELPDVTAERLAAADLVGHAVKLLDFTHWYGVTALPDVPWRFIFVERNHKQQGLSMVKFLQGVAGVRDLRHDAAARLRRSFDGDKPGLIARLKARGELLRVRYEDVLADPVGEALRIGDFTGIEPLAASGVVHHRSPDCAPDLAFEMTGSRP